MEIDSSTSLNSVLSGSQSSKRFAYAGSHSTSSLSSFIASNPSIKDLEFLPGCHFIIDPAEPPCSAGVLERLTSFAGTVETTDRLIGSGTPTKLRSLSIGLPVEELAAAYQIISTAGPFLEELSLSDHFTGLDEDSRIDWVSLTNHIHSTCIGLRKLSVHKDTWRSPVTVPLP